MISKSLNYNQKQTYNNKNNYDTKCMTEKVSF